MDSFLKCVFVRAGIHTSVHDVNPHSSHFPVLSSCLLVYLQSLGFPHQMGFLNIASGMLRIDSLIPLWYQVGSWFYILLECVFWMTHTRTLWTFYSILELLLFSQYGRLLLPHCSTCSFSSGWSVFWKLYIGRAITTVVALTQIGRCCECRRGSNTFFSHIPPMLVDAKMRTWLYPVFHRLLLNDFGSFASWMNVRFCRMFHRSSVIDYCSVTSGCAMAVEVPYYIVSI